MEGCVLKQDFDSFFDHGLGPDCLPDTGDEETATSTTDLAIDRAFSQADCEQGFRFVEEACACFSERQCRVNC